MEQIAKECKKANVFMPTLRRYCEDMTNGRQMSVITKDRYTGNMASVWNSFLKTLSEF